MLMLFLLCFFLSGPVAPTLTISNVSSSHFKVSWNSVDGADSFNVRFAL